MVPMNNPSTRAAPAAPLNLSATLAWASPAPAPVQASALPADLAAAVFYFPTARDRRYSTRAAARRSFRLDRSL